MWTKQLLDRRTGLVADTWSFPLQVSCQRSTLHLIKPPLRLSYHPQLPDTLSLSPSLSSLPLSPSLSLSVSHDSGRKRGAKFEGKLYRQALLHLSATLPHLVEWVPLQRLCPLFVLYPISKVKLLYSPYYPFRFSLYVF